MTEEKPRTPTQNRSIHKGFELIAQAFREKGYSVEDLLTILDYRIELEWTKTLVKEILFKQIAKKMFDRDSTKDLTTKELQEVWENMSRRIAPSGVYVPFPSTEEQMLKSLTDQYGYSN